MMRSLKVLIVPSPPPGGMIENGQDRYLDALMKGMGGRVEYIGLDDPQFARGPEKKWEPDPGAQAPVPRWRLARLIPATIRLLMGYVRDAWRLSRLLRPYRNQVDLIHVNRVGCEIQPIAARLAGFKRIVTTIHNLPGEAEKDNWVCRLVERLSFGCGDVHIAVSEATYAAWHKRVGLQKRGTEEASPQAMDQGPVTSDREYQSRKAGVTVREAGLHQPCDGQADGDIRPTQENKVPVSLVNGLWSVVTSAAGKCVVIYNGMNPEDMSGFDRRAYRRQFCEDPEHTFIIGICARLHRMKGHGVLLEAFAKLLKEKWLIRQGARMSGDNPSDKALTTQQLNNTTAVPLLLIAGTGPEEANVRAKMAELGIGEHVRMLGHRRDAERFIASLDLNVLPSVALETIGYSVIEAMFAGVPSVVSDVGGAKEIVAQSRFGEVVPAGNSVALAEAIRHQMTGKADFPLCDLQQFAWRYLSAQTMADATLAQYLKAGA